MSYDHKEQTDPGSDVAIWAAPVGDVPPPGDPVGPSYIWNPDTVKVSEVRSKSTQSWDKWNDFSHYKLESFAAGPPKVLVHSDTNHWGWYGERAWRFESEVPINCVWPSSPFGPVDVPLRDLPALWTESEGQVIVPAPAELDELLNAAARHILPLAKKDLSLINSLLELKDLKSILTTKAHVLDTARRFLHSFGSYKLPGMSRPVGKLSGRELLRRKGDIYLQYKFNIAPTLSDIYGIANAFLFSNKKAHSLVRRSETARRGHFIKMLPGNFAYQEYGDVQRATPQQVPFYETFLRPYRWQQLDPSKFHAEIQYSYYYTEFQKRHAAWLTFLDKLGVNLNPAIIWNAIPWSFVVDWVVGIGPWLESYGYANMEPVINIQRCLWSIRRTRYISTMMDVQEQKQVPVRSVKETAYRRQNYTMKQHWIESSGLSPTEVSLALALGVTRHPRPRTRVR